MLLITDEIVSELVQLSAASRDSFAATAAAEMFVRSRSHEYVSLIVPEINDLDTIPEDDVEIVKQSLLDCLGRPLSDGIRSSVVWALGKLRDSRLVPIFHNCVKESIDPLSLQTLYQSLIALDDIDGTLARLGVQSIGCNDKEQILSISHALLDRL